MIGYTLDVWMQVRRLVAELELGLLSLGGQSVGAEQVQFAWPKVIEYVGLKHAEGKVLPVDARLKFGGRSLARPDVQDQPKPKPQWRYTEEGRRVIAAAITVPAAIVASFDGEKGLSNGPKHFAAAKDSLSPSGLDRPSQTSVDHLASHEDARRCKAHGRPSAPSRQAAAQGTLRDGEMHPDPSCVPRRNH